MASPPPPQRLLGPDDSLYFLHIPKCAGTAFRLFLEDHFDTDQICQHTGILDDILPLPPSDLGRHRLICGHFGWYLHRLMPRPPVVITVLREPGARTLSQFYDLRHRTNNWLHQIIRGWTFEQFLHHPIGISEITNFQVRSLALDRIQEDYWDHSPIRDRDIDALVAKYSDPRLLDRALERLESMAAFGLAERFNDSIRLVAHTFGWPAWTRPPRLNVRESERDAGDLTPRALEQVRRLTALDQALYEHAARLFEQRIGALTPDVADAGYSAAMAARPRVSSVRYGFDRALFGDGWYWRSLGKEGPVNRWTGPTNAPYLDLPLAADRDLRVVFNVGALAVDQIESLRLLVNAQPVPLSRWKARYASATDTVFSGVIPRRALMQGNGYSRLCFEVSRSIRHCDVNPRHARDQRPLALHFRWIEINPA